VTIHGERHELWRAVDQDGTGRDRLVPRRRNPQAAHPFVRTRRKGLTSGPWVLMTDPLTSYGAATREGLSGTDRHVMVHRCQIWHEGTGTATAYRVRCRWRENLRA
jgi:transposase-like protein